MLIASGIVCVILPKDKPVHLSLIHLPRIPIGSVQVIEIINQFVVEFHDCSYSCFQKPLGGCMARCIKQNHAAQRHCEKQSVSSAVRASVGMFFRGPHSAYEVVPCERERYSFSPGHWSPFARTNFWQNRGEAGRTMAFELLTLLLLREPFVFTLAADEDDEPGERSHGPHNTVPRRTPYSGIDPR